MYYDCVYLYSVRVVTAGLWLGSCEGNKETSCDIVTSFSLCGKIMIILRHVSSYEIRPGTLNCTKSALTDSLFLSATC